MRKCYNTILQHLVIIFMNLFSDRWTPLMVIIRSQNVLEYELMIV